jgi:Fe-S-cluster containining protein
MRSQVPPRVPPWAASPERAELLALYREADALTEGWACACTQGSEAERRLPRCCHFGITGREPYPTAVEVAEVRHAVRAAGLRTEGTKGRSRLEDRGRHGTAHRRSLPVVADGADPRAPELPEGARPCPLLSAEGRCRIYASRPFGCRTFFCLNADGPDGPRSRPARDAASAIGRRIADLSARFDPRDPRPRPLTHALSEAPGRRLSAR